MSLRWYAGRTMPLAEYAARDHLRRAGLEVFLPCAWMRTPRPGHQDAPLFPGYLFLHHDLEQSGLGQLRRIPQFVGLVDFGEEVPAVPDEVIEELALRVDAINGKGELWNRYRPGEVVSVAMGPTESLAEVVEAAESPGARVRVLVEFLGRLVEAKVPWKGLQPVNGHRHSGEANGRPLRRTRGGGRWIRGHGPRTVEGPKDLLAAS